MPADLSKTILNTLVALVVGTIGGTAFYYLHTPLPWTLGSLFTTAIMALAGGKWFLPKFAWSIARPAIGVLAGSTFTLAVVLSIPGWWDSLLALLFYSVIVTFLGWLFFTRVCKYDDVTSFFASAPGGLGELSLLGGSLGGSVRTLVLIHAVRVVLMVFTVPFIVAWFFLPDGASLSGLSTGGGTLSAADWAVLLGCGVLGYFLGRPFNGIGGVMLAPMLLSAAAHIFGLTDATPPPLLVAGVQILIGSITGSRFAGTSWAELRSTALYGVVWSVFLLVAAMIAAFTCSLITDEPLLALILAFTPGGIVEITVIAYAVGLHVAFIVTMQLCRVISVLMLTPALFKLVPNPRLPGEPPEVDGK
jgi:membrane AbrB-like protein